MLGSLWTTAACMAWDNRDERSRFDLVPRGGEGVDSTGWPHSVAHTQSTYLTCVYTAIKRLHLLRF